MPLMHRDKTGFDLFQRERLDHVVVGAVIESFELILQRIARGQHQHRCVKVRFLAKFPA